MEEHYRNIQFSVIWIHVVNARDLQTLMGSDFSFILVRCESSVLIAIQPHPKNYQDVKWSWSSRRSSSILAAEGLTATAYI